MTESRQIETTSAIVLSEPIPRDAQGFLLCSYCGLRANLVDKGDTLYPFSSNIGPMWVCPGICDAHIGCFRGTESPLGRLANAELRAAKIAAQAVFDQLWKRKMRRDKCSKNAARRAGYAWLAKQMGIPARSTHIGNLTPDGCRKVVEICQPFTDNT